MAESEDTPVGAVWDTSALRSGPVPEVNPVMQALQRPVLPVPEVLQNTALLPGAPGLYGWWSRRGALARVPHVPHPLQAEVSLLYVGISPARFRPHDPDVQQRTTGAPQLLL
jgi:hypothetical protein